MKRFSYLDVRHLDGRRWLLLAPFSFQVVEGGETITVPEGFVTDMASIPRPARWWHSPTGRAGKPSVIHDWLYANAGRPVPAGRGISGMPMLVEYSRKEADRIFLEGLRLAGFRWISRRAMYRAVRLFGWVAWNRHKRKTVDTRSRVGVFTHL